METLGHRDALSRQAHQFLGGPVKASLQMSPYELLRAGRVASVGKVQEETAEKVPRRQNRGPSPCLVGDGGGKRGRISSGTVR